MDDLLTRKTVWGIIRRSFAVTVVLIKFLSAELGERLKITPLFRWIFRGPKAKGIPTEVRLRKSLQSLGPTYIKLGQILSTRYDLLPPAFIIELEKLQDSVEPFSFYGVLTQIEKGLGRKASEVFERIDETPLASASIAQVHRALLKTGEDVVVKVQRPNIYGTVNEDLSIMNFLVLLVEKLIPSAKYFQPRAMLEEFMDAIFREMDFTIEAQNAIDFSKNFEGVEGVGFPKVYPEFTSREIITMDYIDGVKITKAGELIGADDRVTSGRGFHAILRMIFEHGLFHADPHPANIFVISGNNIVFLDLGLVGRIPEDFQHRFFKMQEAMMSRKWDEVTRLICIEAERFGGVPDGFNRDDFTKDIAEQVEKFLKKTMMEFNFIQVLGDMLSLVRKHRLVLPAENTLIMKAFITVDGIGRRLNPDFDPTTETMEYIQGAIKRKPSLALPVDGI